MGIVYADPKPNNECLGASIGKRTRDLPAVVGEDQTMYSGSDDDDICYPKRARSLTDFLRRQQPQHDLTDCSSLTAEEWNESITPADIDHATVISADSNVDGACTSSPTASDRFDLISRSPSSVVWSVAQVELHWASVDETSATHKRKDIARSSAQSCIPAIVSNADHGFHLSVLVYHLFCDMSVTNTLVGVSVKTCLRGVPLCFAYQRDDTHGPILEIRDVENVADLFNNIFTCIESGDEFGPGRVGFSTSFSAYGVRVHCHVGRIGELKDAIKHNGPTVVSFIDPTSVSDDFSNHNDDDGNHNIRVIPSTGDGMSADYGFDALVALWHLFHNMVRTSTMVGISVKTYHRSVPMYFAYQRDCVGPMVKFDEDEVINLFNNVFIQFGPCRAVFSTSFSEYGVRVHCRVGDQPLLE